MTRSLLACPRWYSFRGSWCAILLAFGWLSGGQDSVVFGGAVRDEVSPLEAKRILFLGDSITHAGQYVAMIETQLRLQGLDPLPEIINVGLGSETCCGLSEPDHPFPRPNVQDRLDRALELVRPDLVVACYGMNDGIYHPFGEDRFLAFQEGIRTLVRKSRAAGAQVVLLTPPPFDPQPLRNRPGKLVDLDAPEFGYKTVFRDYDSVLKRYGQWQLDEQPADLVIDLHGPITEFVQSRRKVDTDFTVSGDGIHPNADGHQIMATTILNAWGVESWEEPPANLAALVRKKTSIIHDAWLSHIGHQRPGVRPGLPMEEAEAAVERLEEDIRKAVQEFRKSPVSERSVPGGILHQKHYAGSLRPDELRIAVDYFLWVPNSDRPLRGIVVHQHGCGEGASLGGRTAAEDLHWQALAAKWNCALLGSSYEPRRGINCRLWCDCRNGSENRFLQSLQDFAAHTGRLELETVPWCLWGHSGGAFWSSLMHARHPDRVVGVWLRSGTAFGYWEKGEIAAPELSPAVYGVPVMCNPGRKERDHERFHTAWDYSHAMFTAYRKAGAPIAFADDPATAHECGDSRYLAIPWFDACLQLRLPETAGPLRPLDRTSGFLGDPRTRLFHHPEDYSGDPRQAAWLPTQKIAEAWSQYLKDANPSDPTPPPSPVVTSCTPHQDGTMRLSWTPAVDFESGISEYRVYVGEDLVHTVSGIPHRFGRPVVQGMSYHDTPSGIIDVTSTVLPAAADNAGYSMTAVNTVGMESARSDAVQPTIGE